MWMMMTKTTTTFLLLLVVVVTTFVASERSLADFTKEELEEALRDPSFLQEVLSCAHCQSSNCRELTRAIMGEIHIVVNGCHGCPQDKLDLAVSLADRVQRQYKDAFQKLLDRFSEGPVTC